MFLRLITTERDYLRTLFWLNYNSTGLWTCLYFGHLLEVAGYLKKYVSYSHAPHLQANYARTAHSPTLPHRDVSPHIHVVSHNQVLSLLEPDANLITHLSSMKIHTSPSHAHFWEQVQLSSHQRQKRGGPGKAAQEMKSTSKNASFTEREHRRHQIQTRIGPHI